MDQLSSARSEKHSLSFSTFPSSRIRVLGTFVCQCTEGEGSPCQPSFVELIVASSFLFFAELQRLQSLQQPHLPSTPRGTHSHQTFYNPLACTDKTFQFLAESRPLVHRAALELGEQGCTDSWFRLGVLLNLQIFRGLAGNLPFGCNVVWGQECWGGRVINCSERETWTDDGMMVGGWLQQPYLSQTKCLEGGSNRERCWTCRGFEGDDLFAAVKKGCDPEELTRALPGGMKGVWTR